MSGRSHQSFAAKEKLIRAVIESKMPLGDQQSWDIPINEDAMAARAMPGHDARHNPQTRRWPRLLSGLFMAVMVGAFLILAPVTEMDSLSGIFAGGATNAQSSVLMPEVRYDVLKFKLDQAIAAKDHRQTIAIITRLRATRLGIGDEVPFYEGRAYIALKNWTGAYRSLVIYLNSVGRGGENYDKAIALFVTSERAIKTGRRSETGS